MVAATSWVLARPNIEGQQLISSVAMRLAFMDPEQAAKLLTHLAPGSAREQAISRVIGSWMYSDVDGALAFSNTLPAAEQEKLRGGLAAGLAYRDPARALAYLKENPVDDPAAALWATLAQSIARKDSPAKALEWASSLPELASRQKALPPIFAEFVKTNPSEAARQAAALPDEAARHDSLSSVGGTWARTEMDEALTWARSLTGKDQETAVGAVLSQGARYQPGVAAKQFDALIAGVPAGTKPAEGLLNAAGAVASAYFDENEQAAANWAVSLPQEDARAAAIKSLAEQWARYDPLKASEWIGTLPAGAPRDAAVGQLVGKIASSDPASAFAWAATVVDLGDRSNLLQAAFTSWRKIDAPAARAAIEASAWPDTEKSKWLDKVK